jgi:PKD repeat protein
MVKGIVTVAFVCAALVIIGFSPVVAGGDHVISKNGNGPWRSARTWTFLAPTSGEYSWQIENSGLRWVLFLVYDNSTGVPVEIFREQIKFAACGAYPNGTVTTSSILMVKDGVYDITAVPNGRKGAHATVIDQPLLNEPPVASFTYTTSGCTVCVDASSSYDVDGILVSYLWDWGDGSTGEGVTASHIYVCGTYAITLTVIDNQGLSDSITAFINFDGPALPMAIFTYTFTADWHTILVNGSGSYAVNGAIVSYAWDFGDGYTATGVTATHSFTPTIGSYAVTLNVTDSNGLKNTSAQYVEVFPVTTPSIAVLRKSSIANGFKIEFTAPTSVVEWGNLTVRLSIGTSAITWSEIPTSGLTNPAPPAIWIGGELNLGGLRVFLNVTDLAANGVMSNGDYVTLTTAIDNFSPVRTYTLTLIYEPTDGSMLVYDFTG